MEETKERDNDKLSNAFLDGGSTIAGYTLRPFTFGTAKLARKMGLTMFTGEERPGEQDLTDEEAEQSMLDQIAAYVWMQSTPVESVVKHVTAGTWEYEVDVLAMNLPISSAADFMADINEIQGMVSEAAVDVAPKHGDSASEKDAPPN